MRISIYELGTSDGYDSSTYYHLWSSTQHDPGEVRRLLRHAERLKPSRETELGDGVSGEEKVSDFLSGHDLHPFVVHDLRDEDGPCPIPQEYLSDRLVPFILVSTET